MNLEPFLRFIDAEGMTGEGSVFSGGMERPTAYEFLERRWTTGTFRERRIEPESHAKYYLTGTGSGATVPIPGIWRLGSGGAARGSGHRY